MNTLEIFEDPKVRDQFEASFEKKDKLEMIQLLSDLKYLPKKAFEDGIIDHPELSNAIHKFRVEVEKTKEETNMSNFYKVILSSEMIEPEERSLTELTQREVHILKEITGLDQELVIHQIDLETTSLLSRVLIYRYRIYDIIDRKIFPHHKLTSKITETLQHSVKELGYTGDWISFGNLLADQNELSRFCITSPVLNRKVFGNCIFINITNDHGREVIDDLGRRIRRKELFIKNIAAEPLQPLIRTIIHHNDREKVTQHVQLYLNMRPNIFMRRVLQVKLWMMGLYHGRLDDYFGPLSINALHDFLMTIIDKVENGRRELGKILHDLKNDQCIINIDYLLKEYFIPVENTEVPYEQGSVSQIFDFVLQDKSDVHSFQLHQQEKIDEMSGELKDSLETELMNESDKILQESSRNIRQYKSKKGIAKFFSKIFKFVKNVFQKIKKLFLKLMGLVKKAAKVIFNEIREAFQNFKNGMKFLFGKRIIQPTTQITTDYDFDFDGITKVHSKPSENDFALHTKMLKEYSEALYSSLNFVKIVIQWGIRVLTGPVGWLKILLGIAKIFKNWLRQKAVIKIGFKLAY